jgi:hypothetical protein
LLGNDDFENLTSSVLVASNKNEISIKSVQENIKSVIIYDVLGRILYQNEKVNHTQTAIHTLMQNQQTLLVKVKLNNGQIITKKIVF